MKFMDWAFEDSVLRGSYRWPDPDDFEDGVFPTIEDQFALPGFWASLGRVRHWDKGVWEIAWQQFLNHCGQGGQAETFFARYYKDRTQINKL